MSLLVVVASGAACADSDATSDSTASATTAAPGSTETTIAATTTVAAVPAPDGIAPPTLDFTLNEFVDRWEAGIADNTNDELLVDSISTPPPEEQFDPAWTETILLGSTPLGQVGVAALADSELVIEVNYLLPFPTSSEFAQAFFAGLVYVMTVVDPLLTDEEATQLFAASGIAQQSGVDSYANEVEANGILHCFVISEGQTGLGYRAGSVEVGTLCQQGPLPGPGEGA